MRRRRKRKETGEEKGEEEEEEIRGRGGKDGQGLAYWFTFKVTLRIKISNFTLQENCCIAGKYVLSADFFF